MLHHPLQLQDVCILKTEITLKHRRITVSKATLCILSWRYHTPSYIPIYNVVLVWLYPFRNGKLVVIGILSLFGTNYFLLQHICRRLLAVYDLPSWGRCELALSLLLEENAPYSLEDVVQAVRESHDREFIKRVLTKECPICLSIFPHSKVIFFSHSATSKHVTANHNAWNFSILTKNHFGK